jgi:hypothetical protein
MSHHGACVPTSIRPCVLDRHSRVQRQRASGTKTRRRGVSGHRVSHRRTRPVQYTDEGCASRGQRGDVPARHKRLPVEGRSCRCRRPSGVPPFIGHTPE